MATDGPSAPGDGITGGYTGNNLGVQIAMATFTGIAWYNAIELIVLLFVTFSQYKGLYFWSLLCSAVVGVVPYSLGFLLKFFNLTSARWLSVTFLTVGWYFMVTGQSIVLYSRLHLVLRNPRVLQRVLFMIIADAIVLHVPTTVVTFGSNFDYDTTAYVRGYNVMEKIQMTGFCLQEFIISGLYIIETVKLLKLNPDKRNRKIMYQLLGINLLIIAMDLGLLLAEYLNFYVIETTLKGAVYSVKLKLEFAVLGKLVHLVHSHGWKPQPASSPNDFPDFVDATRVTSDVTHAAPTIRYPSHPWMDPDDIDIAVFEHSENPRDQEIGHSELSGSWSGETQTNELSPGIALAPTDFTNALRPSSNDKYKDRPG
ncbi:hypothetical protein DTO164E3_6852 [Paecilomyces variotii]|uniref:Integral membrane protein n=1 Tax=Byssochlamys spectabilis TaxID=264951 RepID=A0A443HQS0_BYSSP|nr:integral membrane protein [Paecilomyces variotii]KAJ9193230.1 hypothetical protein DTO032I3_7902 [Paecilomyces variotii]KAJ9195316.1 hypothetical protein DTO164E3_6852 [Paecilomyces variotii]KAJ9269540.1 hypothetical protein DTO212C5_4391 [Paecilomyces variotii]KAJ9281289.1 hypothetical protein DTO021D3_1948 [Paecilomyces variotii]KAJ9295880.1 hypothetical protein DTO217A2_8942 [Paecilomyces variotii]